MTALDLVGVCAQLQRACTAAGSQRAWAEAHGVSAQFVSAVLNAQRAPSPAVLKALGLRQVVRYVPVAGAQDRIAGEMV